MTASNAINMQPFCHMSRLDLARPVTINGRDALATNTEILIVVPDHPRAGEFRIAYLNVYPKLLNALANQKLYAPYKSDQPSIRLDAMHLDPTPDCPTCHGSGEMKKQHGWCPDCYGTGTKYVPIAVGEAHFQLMYLNLMTEHLPYCTLQLPTDNCLGKARTGKPTPFVFEGGYGWLAACYPTHGATA